MAGEQYKPIKPKCIGNGCEKDAFARGMCKTHYSRWRLHGHCETTHKTRLPEHCEIEGCDRKTHARWKRGKAVCNIHWQNLYRYGSEAPPPEAPPDPLPLCSIHKCKNEVRSRNAEYCEKHYGRVRRGVSIENDRAHLHSYISGAGYVVLTNQRGHPLADKEGRLTEHRSVAYRKHEGKCPECFWCGKQLTWADAVVDHLDENKQNNTEENLAVACNPCNRARGALLPFMASMRDDALQVFFDRIVEYRKSSRDKQREEANT
jgi:hypothetical protein